MMQKGVIIDAGSKWTVVLTPDGQFCKVPSKPHYTEGMEITFSIPVPVPSFATKKIMSKPLIRNFSLVAACLLLIVMIFPFISGNQAYAAVTIDINPSLELDADQQANVIAVHALNADGKKLLDQIQWKNQKVSLVALEIIKAAEANGLMNKQNQVIISTTFYKSEAQDQGQQWSTMLEDATSKVDPQVTVVLVNGNKQWFDDAKKQDVAPGSYMVIKQAEQQGIALQMDDIANGELNQLPNMNGVKVIHPKKQRKEQREPAQAGQDAQLTNAKAEDNSGANAGNPANADAKPVPSDNATTEHHENKKDPDTTWGQQNQPQNKKQDAHDDDHAKKKVDQANEGEDNSLNHGQQKKISDHEDRGKNSEKMKKERD